MDHLRDHHVLVEEAEWVLTAHFARREPSRSSDYSLVSGYTRAGRFLIVVFDYVAESSTVIPITAFEPEGQ